MNKTSSLLSIIAITWLISACSNNERNIEVIEGVKENKAISKSSETQVKFSPSIIIKGTDLILFPLNLNEENDDSYKRSSNTNYWNLAFYNILTGKSELLTKQKLIINNFTIGDSGDSHIRTSSLSDQFIYYEIINSDFNDDKKLTLKDPQKLFISNLEGKSFIQISPEDYALQNWKADRAHNVIIMALIKDSNGDKEFNDQDETEYFIYDLKTRQAPKPVFDNIFKKEVSELANKVL